MKSSPNHITKAQWCAVAILTFINLINYMDRYTIAGILTQVQDYYSISDTEAGFLQTIFVLSYMIFAPVFGYLGDRYSRKWIMAVGVGIWVLAVLVGSFMESFLAFLGCRAMVGIGEASYSTIAPTIISDMFVKDTRSKMLALFYFAIPVGSGLGYIVGSETARIFGDWQWGLRATPVLGIVAVVLILFLLTDPPRGESEGHEDLQAASYREDLAYLATNTSFILSTLGFTCVTFCTGALSWWGPIFIQRGLETQPEEERAMNPTSVPFVFGVVTMMSGVVGVPLGMILSTKLKAKYPRADPVICGVGILISAVFLTLGMLMCESNIVATFAFIFIGEVSLNLNWSIVADILLYVVTPTCRSTAEAVQILLSHTFGDAGSPYLIGLISDGLFTMMVNGAASCGNIVQDMADASSNEAAIINSMKMMEEQENVTEEVVMTVNSTSCDHSWEMYRSLQYSFFSNSGVEVVGGVLFLLTAIFIVRDKLACELAVSEIKFETEQASRPMLKPGANLEMLSADEEEEETAPKLQLLDDQQESSIESSRSVTPDV